jgi:methionine-S-sulfoxide reductase
MKTRPRPGVISTRVGYTGGDVPNATYRNHHGHAEAMEIIFDPDKISYRDLLEFFFQVHDPTTLNRQGNDIGTSYRSAIFYLSDAQKQTAEDTIADVDASGLWPGKVVTEVTAAVADRRVAAPVVAADAGLMSLNRAGGPRGLWLATCPARPVRVHGRLRAR